LILLSATTPHSTSFFHQNCMYQYWILRILDNFKRNRPMFTFIRQNMLFNLSNLSLKSKLLRLPYFYLRGSCVKWKLIFVIYICRVENSNIYSCGCIAFHNKFVILQSQYEKPSVSWIKFFYCRVSNYGSLAFAWKNCKKPRA